MGVTGGCPTRQDCKSYKTNLQKRERVCGLVAYASCGVHGGGFVP